MSEALNLVYQSIDRQHADSSAHTRRQLVAGAAATLGGMGMLGLAPEIASAAHKEDPQTILNVAATAEVLATIVNTVAFERNLGGDSTTQRNLGAAAREELIHYQVLTGLEPGRARPLTLTVHVPDAVFASRTSLLNTLVIGDQIFVNAYLIATTAFANRGDSELARIAAEFMAVEAVHRALARQSLGLLGNDRAFAKYSQAEEAIGPGKAPGADGLPGFRKVLTAVAQLEAAGFGFGKAGSLPGSSYGFDTVSARTPNPSDVNTRVPK